LAGPPLRALDVSREQITPVEGLSALSLDAFTSVAYGPETILAVLAAAGAGALHLVLPITAAIIALLAILAFPTGAYPAAARTRWRATISRSGPACSPRRRSSSTKMRPRWPPTGPVPRVT
jgi:hypothetical protein